MRLAPLPSAAALGRLLLAHPICGVGIALVIRSGLGAAPWDVFHLGLHRATGLSVGAASGLTAAAAILLAYLGGIRPGLATAVNAVLIGVCIDVALAWLPPAPGAALAVAYGVAGLLCFGLGSGLYLAARLGSAPRDSLMLALVRWRGWSPRRARAIVELAALGAGLLLGGSAGVGTLVFALAIGPVVQWGIALFAPRGPAAGLPLTSELP